MATPSGLPSPGQIADKLFGYSDPNENAAWQDQFQQFRDVQADREKTGFVDSLQMASQMAVGAVAHAKSTGAELAADLGEETGLFPGHMAPSASQKNDRESEPEPEKTFSDQLVDRIESKFKDPQDSASKSPRLLGENFGR